MSTPFDDLAARYDTLTKQLRELGDQWALGTLSVGESPVEEPVEETKKK